MIPQPQKLQELRKLIEAADLSLQQAKDILYELAPGSAGLAGKAKRAGYVGESEQGQVIEGVFDGQQMIGPDGKRYGVPANYASKSKLVEGDLMKLTIDGFGNFIFKQIGPVQRIRLKGTLAQDEQSEDWRVLAEGKAYKVLMASVTYFKGYAGDTAVILVPKDRSSSWAAVENIVSSSHSSDRESSNPGVASESHFEPSERAPVESAFVTEAGRLPPAEPPAAALSDFDRI